MDFDKLIFLIEEHRKHTALTSLPFLIEIKNKKYATWFEFNFIYSNNKKEKDILQISEISIMNDDSQVINEKVNVQINLVNKCEKDPGFPEALYFKNLKKLYNDFKEEKMDNLIKKAEVNSLLPAYKIIKNYIKNKKERDEYEENSYNI